MDEKKEEITTGVESEKIEEIENNSTKEETSEIHEQSCLSRLLESDHFDVSMALLYYLSANQTDISDMVIKKLFSFTPAEIAWYLMQLIHMYLHSPMSQSLIYENLKLMSSNDLKFSLLCTWHLEAYLVGYTSVGETCINLLKKLINSILTLWCLNKDTNNISLFVTERSFVTELVLISRRLQTVATKSIRLHRLHAELLTLDRSLSQPIFIPLVSLPDHVVVRIPYKESSVLNSKDKAPYLMYVEVIERSGGQSNFIDVNAFRQEEFKKFIKTHKPNSKSISSDINPSEISSLNNISDLNQQSSIWSKISVSDIRKKIESNSQQTLIRSSVFINSEDPSANSISEPWEQKVARIKDSSPFGSFPGWNLYSIIVKYGDDLRQDYLAYQFLKVCKNIWEIENIQVWVRPYCVVITESQAGIIEAISDAVSIHQIKNRTGCSLEGYFRQEYGLNSDSYNKAKKAFIHSLAGYSLFQYIFQVRDRHNGNILLDHEGHIIHIDFGYILGQSPKNISFETSPFKMSVDFIELLEGSGSDLFLYFKSLMYFGFMALRKHMDKLIVLVDIMKAGDAFPCLGSKGHSVENLKSRFKIELSDDQVKIFIERLINQSTNSLTTFIYDKFQYYTNGIRI